VTLPLKLTLPPPSRTAPRVTSARRGFQRDSMSASSYATP
jgi:hypothetical protein